MRKWEWLPAFHAVAACSWVPHWACHYFRLETRSTFAVGSWEFSRRDSVLALSVYGAAICLNLGAVLVSPARFWAAVVSGVGHMAIGLLHLVRLASPFRFEVMGHVWSTGASFREAVVAVGFGVVCLWVAVELMRYGP